MLARTGLQTAVAAAISAAVLIAPKETPLAIPVPEVAIAVDVVPTYVGSVNRTPDSSDAAEGDKIAQPTPVVEEVDMRHLVRTLILMLGLKSP
jgi:hypothetical protein